MGYSHADPAPDLVGRESRASGAAISKHRARAGFEPLRGDGIAEHSREPNLGI